MERPEEGKQPPPPQPWGRLLRLGAEEGEPHVLLRKREWTIGRRNAVFNVITAAHFYNSTVMCRSATGIQSEKCVVRQFHHLANIMEYT
uniref:Uncharacterized protein n=1 Tax=Piliocolobus tephrosceles TaxID=591936 RepID=A0A8C9I7D5_9PRIM